MVAYERFGADIGLASASHAGARRRSDARPPRIARHAAPVPPSPEPIGRVVVRGVAVARDSQLIARGVADVCTARLPSANIGYWIEKVGI